MQYYTYVHRTRSKPRVYVSVCTRGHMYTWTLPFTTAIQSLRSVCTACAAAGAQSLPRVYRVMTHLLRIGVYNLSHEYDTDVRVRPPLYLSWEYCTGRGQPL